MEKEERIPYWSEGRSQLLQYRNREDNDIHQASMVVHTVQLASLHLLHIE